ncbi:hypothetical protein FKM82_016957 [Ascaphus truei]
MLCSAKLRSQRDTAQHFQAANMDTEKTTPQKHNQKTTQRIVGASASFTSSQSFPVGLAPAPPKPMNGIPLDVYGKPETYRWRTAYDEAYNRNKECMWI